MSLVCASRAGIALKNILVIGIRTHCTIKEILSMIPLPAGLLGIITRLMIVDTIIPTAAKLSMKEVMFGV